MRLALIVMLPFLGACLPMLLARAGRNACAMATGLASLMSFGLLLTHAPEIVSGKEVHVGWNWVPQIGLNADFYLDGLGLLMAGLILGIGLLIIVYATFYLAPHERIGNFFTYLLIFQGAMVGVALSENILMLLVFWELTSLSSFLLIGFWSHLTEGRQGARMALIITGGGGLSLTAGMLLLGNIAGSYDLQEIFQQRDLIQNSPWYPTILGLILIGCFTKSAQFPFHFWLPHAMAAPTPVSAYLHSATMVKAGVFLLARLWPVLAGTDLWFYAVATTGLVTMVIGAVIALYQHDLKGLLAYSTVSHLGLMTLMLGLGTPMGVVAALLHLMSHAVFKASLFMVAGIIDHETGTRDIRRLSGLMGWLPITGTLALIGTMANAGLPPLNGFLSKEMMLEEVWHSNQWNGSWLLPITVVFASIFSVAYSARFFISVFLGKRTESLQKIPHEPSKGLLIPPLILVLLALAMGLYAAEFTEPILKVAARDVVGPEPLPDFHLKLWHGWNIAIYSSLFSIAVGVVLFAFSARASADDSPVSSRSWIPDGKRIFQSLISRCILFCQWFVHGWHNGSLSRYLITILLGSIALGSFAFATSTHEAGTRAPLPIDLLVLPVALLLVASCVATVILHRQRLIGLITVNVAGLIACIGFVYFSAPDLALTQIAVEVVTLILILLAMFFWPKFTPVESTRWRQWRDGTVAVLSGLAMTGLTWAVLTRNYDRSLADFFVEQSKPAGGGSNVVNVILVDFRGFDTFNEIAVLGISALVIYALLDGAMHGIAGRKLDTWVPDQPRSPEKHPKLFLIATRIMLPLSLMVGVYMLLRGHNQPGGGFVAGLVVTIALIMQYMVSGYQWASERISIDYHGWIGWGVLIAAATGITSMIMDFPFLTTAHNHFYIPGIGDIEVSSALAFDAGVFMTVVGAVMLTLANLSRLGRRAEQAALRSARQEQGE